MISIKERITENLNRLPEPMLLEVLDFIEFLAQKMSNQSEDPLLEIAGILSGDPMTAEEIEKELYDYES